LADPRLCAAIVDRLASAGTASRPAPPDTASPTSAPTCWCRRLTGGGDSTGIRRDVIDVDEIQTLLSGVIEVKRVPERFFENRRDLVRGHLDVLLLTGPRAAPEADQPVGREPPQRLVNITHGIK
jgi:hypothetical protein